MGLQLNGPNRRNAIQQLAEVTEFAVAVAKVSVNPLAWMVRTDSLFGRVKHLSRLAGTSLRASNEVWVEVQTGSMRNVRGDQRNKHGRGTT